MKTTLRLLVTVMLPVLATSALAAQTHPNQSDPQALADVSAERAATQADAAAELMAQSARRETLKAIATTPPQADVPWEPDEATDNPEAQAEAKELAKIAKASGRDGMQAAEEIMKAAQSANQAPWMAKEIAKGRERALGDIEALAQSPIEEAPPRVVVYISFGMSDDILKALFEQANNMGGVVFVIRGLINKSIKPITQKMKKLTDGDIRFKLEIDPKRFAEWNIDAVPVFQFAGENDIPIFIKGTASIRGALSWGGIHGNYTLGELYPIAEPDLIVEMKTMMANRDWTEDIERAKAKVEATLSTSTALLPTATKSRTYWVDPTVTAQSDISSPDGTLIAKEGQKINPLAMTRLSKRYVIFNATDEKQLRVVDHWVKTRGALTLIATELPPTTLAHKALGDRFDNLVMLTNPLINKRFKLHHVPAIVSQDNLLLKVEVINPEDTINE